jgi:hypothetical protein
MSDDNGYKPHNNHEAEDRPLGRRTHPNAIPREPDDLPEDCLATVRHVINCRRCQTAFAQHIDTTVAQTVAYILADNGGSES